MFNSRRARNAVIGTALWLVSGCQSSSFVSHEERVQGGGSVPLELKSTFAGGNGSDIDGQMVACLALPTGWAAPSASYTFNGGERADAQAVAELAAEAQTAHAVTGASWHCFVSARVSIAGNSASTGTASLTLPIPAVAQGAYQLEYVTGFRSVETGEGEPTYAAPRFSGRLARTLHVNVDPTTTFDHWAATSQGAEGAASEAARAWYGNGRFLAISGETDLLTSTDGREWTRFTPLREGTEDSIAVDHLVFAREKWFGISDGGIFASADDGHTWAPAYQDPAPEGAEVGRRFLALATNGARVVATGHEGLIAISNDGATWADQSADRARFFPRVVAVQDTFIAVGELEGEEATGPSILVRQNAEGSAWAVLEAAGLADREIAQLAAGNGRIVALTWKDDAETPGIVFVSEDRGTSWTQATGLAATSNAFSPESLALAFVDRTFILGTTLATLDTVNSLPPFELYASADGLTWTSHATGASGNFSAESFATGEQAVVAVSEELSLVATRRPWAKPQVTTETLPYGVVGTAYNAELEASGNGGKKKFTVEGTLPAGLSVEDGAITGTPTAEASAAFTLVATDARGESASRLLNLTVVRPLTSDGSGAQRIVQKGSAFEVRLTADGGLPPYTWSHTGAVEGLTPRQVDSAYVVSGTPTATGSYAITATVVDALGQSSTQHLFVRVVPATVPEINPDPEESQSCGGCSGSGGTGVQALGLAALALLRRARRKK